MRTINQVNESKDLFKIENLSKMKLSSDHFYLYNYDNNDNLVWKSILKDNVELRYFLKKTTELFSELNKLKGNIDIENDLCQISVYQDINIEKLDKLYIYIDGELSVTITDNLEIFDEEYRSEECW